jgi:hypothetical protein
MKELYTYFAWSESDGLMKIGRSYNPVRRMKELSSNPEIVAVVLASDVSEKDAHDQFALSRETGEWFKVSREDVLDFVISQGFEMISIERISSAVKKSRKVLIEIEDTDGELLDALAKEQDRSRSAQARHMLLKAIKEATGEGK